MTLNDLLKSLNSLANTALQEDYDNSGLITGNRNEKITGILVSFDVNEQVLEEAVERQCNVVVAHHPALFRPLKQITDQTATGRLLMKAIKEGVALVAMHTNLDNHPEGVNHELAVRLGLTGLKILSPVSGRLRKLATFVPHSHVAGVREALFNAGAGAIGNYDSCSYNVDGVGTFRAGDEASPFVGQKHQLHFEPEVRIEVVYPEWIERTVVNALLSAHPYEEVAYDLYPLQNVIPDAGSGMIGSFEHPLPEEDFLSHVKSVLGVPVVRHTRLAGKQIQRVAVCGGSGSFLMGKAAAAGADAFLTGDIKYHDFFDAPADLLVVDGGHYETEQFTVQLLAQYLTENFPNFAVLISNVKTNPVNYF